MPIAELIKTLSQFDPETPVVVRGYEAGFNDVSMVELKTMQLNVNTTFYYGAHDCVKGTIVPNKPMTQVVYLGGFNPICDEPELSYRKGWCLLGYLFGSRVMFNVSSGKDVTIRNVGLPELLDVIA